MWRSRRLGGEETGRSFREQSPGAWLHQGAGRGPEHQNAEKGKAGFCSGPSFSSHSATTSNAQRWGRGMGRGVWRDVSGRPEDPGNSCSTRPSLPEGLTLTTGSRSGFPGSSTWGGAARTRPNSSPQSPGKARQTDTRDLKPSLLRVFTSQSPGAGWAGEPLGVVLQVGLLLGLHLQDALHVVLVGELRGAPAQRDRSRSIESRMMSKGGSSCLGPQGTLRVQWGWG